MAEEALEANAEARGSLGLTVNKKLQANGYYEPSLKTQFLPGCPSCGEKHPLANSPPIESETCLECGSPVGTPGPVIEVPAVITGLDPVTLVGRACLSAGKFFDRLRKRFEP